MIKEFINKVENTKRKLAVLNGYPSSFVDSTVKGHMVKSLLEVGGGGGEGRGVSAPLSFPMLKVCQKS
jgi:hypothetical protein